jgi:hypothetical protein
MKSIKGKPAFVGATPPKQRPMALTSVPLKANLKLLVAQTPPGDDRDLIFQVAQTLEEIVTAACKG